jgi:putative transposase
VDADNAPMDADNVHADECIEFTFQSQYAPLTDNDINEIRKMPHSPSQTVGAIVRGFKSAVTKQINIVRATPQMPVWQRNYHEYIITSERFFNNVANYILQNPERWGK